MCSLVSQAVAIMHWWIVAAYSLFPNLLEREPRSQAELTRLLCSLA